MSLQVWLPLNGDLHNQGLSDLNVTNNGATIDNNGKIGQCYYFNNSAMTFNSPNNIKSIAFWIKTTITGSTIAFVDSKSQLAFGFTASNNIIITCNSLSKPMYPSTNFINNVWNHIAIINTNSNVLLYINGVLQTTNLNNSYWSYTDNPCQLGGRPTGNNMTCYMNDFRMYDHALSAKEIEELAKGLVLHYKLDSAINKNILTSSASKSATVASGGTNVYTGYWYLDTSYHDLIVENTILTVEYDYDIDISTITSTTTYLYSQFNTSAISPMNSLTYNEIVANPSGHKIDTFKVTSAQASYANSFRFRIRLNTTNEGASFTISNINMYFGNSSNNICYDSSGYDNNGTIFGTLTISNNTSKNSYSTYVGDGRSDYIATPNLYFNNEAITLNIWFKSTSTSPIGNYHMIIDSTTHRQWYEMCISNTGFFRGGLFVNGARQVGNCSSKTGLNGEWHMLTLSYNGNTVKRFFDGVLESSTPIAISTGLSSPTALQIFKDGTSNSYACIETYLSDFRIYATALTDEQILELYNTSATIDNQGNTYGREIIEDEIVSITKQGQIKSNKIVEQVDTKTSIEKTTKNINSYSFYEY